MEHFVDQSNGKLMLRQWSRDGIVEIESPIKPYCFMRGRDSLGLKHAITHGAVMKKSFKYPQDVGAFKQSIQCFEADIKFINRVMLDMNWNISDVPICVVDIEVYSKEGMPRADNPEHNVICIGMCFDDNHKEFLYIKDFYDEEEKLMVKAISKDFLFRRAELAMIERFMELTKYQGIIVTFNGGETPKEIRAFDIPYIAKRWSLLTKQDISVFDYKMRHCRFFDIYEIYKFEHARIGKSLKGGYSLDNVAKAELGVGKVKHAKQIWELNKKELYSYCLDDGNGSGDVMLTKCICDKTHLIDLKIGLAQLTNTLLVSWNYHKNERQDELRPLMLVDQLVLKTARQLGLVMSDRTYNEDFKVKGAYVQLPVVGLHKGVQNYDVKSMYPNIIINENISPDKGKKLVPLILKRILSKRDKFKEAWDQKKKETGKDDLDLYIKQYNYKVLANVFYGAFANKSSRIASEESANQITRTGRMLLKKIREVSKENNKQSLYGDTDSSFISIEKSKVKDLQTKINETIYPYKVGIGDYFDAILFIGDWEDEQKQKLKGKKKRYLYLDEDGKIGARGYEIVNSGYCRFSRNIVAKACSLVLKEKTLQEVKDFLKFIEVELRSGKYDQDLVLTKNVKDLSQYKFKQKKDGGEHAGQPHVRAYKKWIASGGRHLFDIQYYYTLDDVEPYVYGKPLPANIDYEKYWDKQVLSPLQTVIRSAYKVEIEKVRRRKVKPLAEGQQTLLEMVQQ